MPIKNSLQPAIQGSWMRAGFEPRLGAELSIFHLAANVSRASRSACMRAFVLVELPLSANRMLILSSVKPRREETANEGGIKIVWIVSVVWILLLSTPQLVVDYEFIANDSEKLQAAKPLQKFKNFSPHFRQVISRVEGYRSLIRFWLKRRSAFEIWVS